MEVVLTKLFKSCRKLTIRHRLASSEREGMTDKMKIQRLFGLAEILKF